MPFFQNVLDQDFIGVLVLGDRQLSLNFKVKGNTTGGGHNFMAKSAEPYNLTGNKSLTINYSVDAGLTYTRYSFDISVAAANVAAALASEIATAMNNDATFSTLYTAKASPDGTGKYWLTFSALRHRERWKTYIGNTSAETILRFNFKAGVAELPTYFRRYAIPANMSGAITAATNATPIQITSAAHGLISGRKIVITGVGGNTAANATWTVTVVDANNFTLDGSAGSGAYTSGGGWTSFTPIDSTISLIELSNPVVAPDTQIITDAGLNPAVVQADWQLLKGRSGLFQFQKITVDGSNRETAIIEYPAGAVAGDFAKKTTYVYSGANTSPSQIAEAPYILTSGDLITP